MAIQQLTYYIKQEIGKGLPEDQIRQGLLTAGWKETEISEAFIAAGSPDNISAPKAPMTSGNGEILGIFDLLKRSFKIYKSRFWTLVGIAAIPSSMMLFFNFVSGALMAKLQELLESPFILIVGLLWILVALSVQFWAQIALLYGIKDRNEKIGVKESFSRGWGKINSFAWVLMLIGFITIGGFMFFIIPGVIFSLWFVFSSYILISENIGGMDALMKSKAYVQGYWWSVFRRFLGLGLILAGISAMLAMILGAIAAGINITISKANSSILFELVNFLTTVFLAPLLTTYSFLIYENLKEIKGNFTFNPKDKKWFIAITIIGIFLSPFALLICLGSIFGH